MRTLPLGILVFAALLSAPAAGSIIYSNTTTDTLTSNGFAGNNATELGDQITLAGTDRFATTAVVQFFNQGTTGTFDATLRLFNVGSPVGSQIGSSVPVIGIAAPSGGVFDVSFTLPLLLVPDNLIFTVAPTNQTAGVSLALNLFQPPTVGSSSNTTSIAKISGNYVTLGGTSQNEYFLLQAVPEPGTLGLVGAVLGVTLLRRRRST
jgi:hypothetical protein